MPIYTYESNDGKRVERVYPSSKYPQSIRVGGRRYTLRITLPAAPVIENVAGVHHGAGAPVVIRNKRDIAELEARQPGLKYDPAYYHDRKVR